MAMTLDKLFALGQYENRFHPEAVSKYGRFLEGIAEDVPLDKLTDEDVKQFLSDWEFWEYEHSVKRLTEWLSKCLLGNPESTLSVYPDSFPFWGTWGFKALLVKVYQGKQQQQRLLAAQKEREERAWLAKIEEQARRKQAEKEYQEFLYRINQTIKTFKKQLAKSKKPNFSYPVWLAGYKPNLWCELPLPTKQRIEDWVKPQIQQKVPLVLRDFISWEVSWQVQTSPDAKYEVLGVPCLTWCFTVLVLVTVHLRLIEMKSTRKFQGYAYEIEVRADDLGSFHRPALGGHQDGFSTPIALLFLLAKGELEAPGIAVTDRSSPFTRFAIQGFEEETLEVHDAFRRFIKDIAKEKPLAQALLDKGITDEDTAKLVEAKWDQPLPVSGKVSDTGGADLESVVSKLCELGKTEAEAKKAVETITLPKNATTEEIVSIILGKSYSDS